MATGNYYDKYEVVNLKEYFLELYRYKWLIIGFITLITVLTGLISYYFITPVYQTEFTLKLPQVEEPNNSSNLVHLFQSTSFFGPILKESKGEYSEEKIRKYINENLEAYNPEETGIIKVNIKSENPDFLYELSTKILKKGLEIANRPYKREIDSKKSYLTSLENTLQETLSEIKNIKKDIEEIYASDISTEQKIILINMRKERLGLLLNKESTLSNKIYEFKDRLVKLEPATILSSPYRPQKPVSPDVKQNILLAGFLAFLFSVIYIFIRKLIG